MSQKNNQQVKVLCLKSLNAQHMSGLKTLGEPYRWLCTSCKTFYGFKLVTLLLLLSIPMFHSYKSFPDHLSDSPSLSPPPMCCAFVSCIKGSVIFSIHSKKLCSPKEPPGEVDPNFPTQLDIAHEMVDPGLKCRMAYVTPWPITYQ